MVDLPTTEIIEPLYGNRPFFNIPVIGRLLTFQSIFEKMHVARKQLHAFSSGVRREFKPLICKALCQVKTIELIKK
ncbi:hypothetical protein [Streptococcus suis]